MTNGAGRGPVLFWQTYRYPLIAIALWLVAGSILFGGGFWQAVLDKLRDPAWWAEITLTSIVFTVLVSWMVSLSQKRRAEIDRLPYMGWTLTLRGFGEQDQVQGIYYTDAERLKQSDFERWKFVKSAVSSLCHIRTLSLAEARKRWLSEADRSITIDFSKMNDDDIDRWLTSKLPVTWEMKDGKTLFKQP